ncbi:hypothetical protein fh0823_10850 [Francisella halioticida]|uniref:N-acetyltransferase domain-containing protein n=1 Tax=Francisella halioticida TaxID=549298 RepID=A0ABM6LZZ3_9GAMM|nr:GNAT family protein [Francisella halioticida]ASG68165.1 hypothetical protein CDV26_06980 [Francisella halioticida]BCD90946.1 hypothetical protein fh0823_10850 [Francisella halioticida]
MLFDNLIKTNIKANLISIRAYQDSDFNDLHNCFDSEQLKWFPEDYVDFEDYKSQKLSLQEDRKLIMLSLIDNLDDKIFGITCLFNIDDFHKNLEVGMTWIDKQYQGTGYNLLFKYYLFKFLIEEIKLNRVYLKTDSNNLKSFHAMNGVGLNYEVKLLSHMLVKNGTRLRDSELFSVTCKTWENIKSYMIKKLDKKFEDFVW